MITMKVTPFMSRPGFTLSKLTTPLRSFWVLEDQVREVVGEPVSKWKVPGETAIPAGRYKVLITFSNRFQKLMPQLMDVPGFTGVRIHAGNSAADTEGCLLLGKSMSEDGRIQNSRAAIAEFVEELENYLDMGQEVQIVITR